MTQDEGGLELIGIFDAIVQKVSCTLQPGDYLFFSHYRTRMTFISPGKGQWVKRGCVLPNLEILGGVRHIKNASVVRVLASGPRGPTLTLRQHNTLFPNKTRGNF